MSSATPVVETSNLRKTYKRGQSVAVAGLDLMVPAAGVHGFLGPNGSGKTTTIRMLLGLIRPDAGTMRLFGEPVPEHLPKIVDRIGAIVESPRFFPTMSGRRNLQILGTGIGVSAHRVEEVLEEVGLSGRGKDSFKTYSLGMKQRLAIAGTLLKDPDLYIFDEPTNGLDPAGIREIRGTMRGLAERGKTVLVSSHILSEVQQVADTVTIIGRGRVLAEGRVDDILASATGGVRIGTDDPGRAEQILAGAGWAVTAQPDRSLVISGDPPPDPAEINRILGQQGLWVSDLARTRQGLEDVFMKLTAEEHLGHTQHQGQPRHALGREGDHR